MSDWSELTAVWQTADARVDVAPLRRRAAAHRRWLIVGVIGETVVVGAFAWLSALVARDGLVPWEVVWLVTLWSFTILAVVFALWNRRGTWRALGESVDEYARLTKLRAERQIRSIHFVVGFLVMEIVASVAQLLWFDRLDALAIVLIATFAVVIAMWCWITHRKAARDLAMVEELTR